MAKQKLQISDFPSIVALQAHQAHEDFINRIKRKKLQVSKRVRIPRQVEGIIEGGIDDAVRRYGGVRTGVLKVVDVDLSAFLNQVYDKLTTHIDQLTKRVAKLSLKFLSNPEDSSKALDAKCTLMVTLEYLESFKFVLKTFEDCFGQLRNRLS